MAHVRHLEFSKFDILVSDLSPSAIVLLRIKFRVNQTINRSDIAGKLVTGLNGEQLR